MANLFFGRAQMEPRMMKMPGCLISVCAAALTTVLVPSTSSAQSAGSAVDRRVRPLLDMILPGYDARAAAANPVAPEDELAIKSAATRLHLAHDTRQFDAMGDMFTEDGVLDYQFGFAQGREPIRRMFRAHRKDATGARHHAVNELVVANADGSATLYGYLLVMLVVNPKTGQPTSPTPIASGVETFRFRRVEGRWLIARMTQEETVLATSVSTPEQNRYSSLTATARAAEHARH